MWYFKQTFLRFLGCNHTSMAGSCETLVSRLPTPTSPLLPRWLPFKPVAQFHVSLGCYPQLSHHPVHLVHHGHSLWFLPPTQSLWPVIKPMVMPQQLPHGPKQHVITEEAGPQAHRGLQGWHHLACPSLCGQTRKVSVVPPLVKMLCFSWQWF